MKAIDHYATSKKSTITIQQRSKVMINKKFDETNCNVQKFQQLMNDSGWGNSYNHDYAEGMFTNFSKVFERALKKCAPKTIFFRNEESDITIQQKWVTEQTRKL